MQENYWKFQILFVFKQRIIGLTLRFFKKKLYSLGFWNYRRGFHYFCYGLETQFCSSVVGDLAQGSRDILSRDYRQWPGMKTIIVQNIGIVVGGSGFQFLRWRTQNSNRQKWLYSRWLNVFFLQYSVIFMWIFLHYKVGKLFYRHFCILFRSPICTRKTMCNFEITS